MRLRLPIFFLIFIFIFSSFSISVDAQSSNALILEITDTIDRSSVETLMEGMQRAENEGSEAIVLLLDTPGGGLTETFDIADIIQNSSIPVIGYVFPKGAKAASAGTFILMSTHIASMADYTIIGSCYETAKEG